jgi:heme A synthase
MSTESHEARSEKTQSGASSQSPWMFRSAVMLAVCALGLIVLGASVTSEIQPMPGSVKPVVSPSKQADVLLLQAHTVMAWAVGILTLGLAIWFQSAETRAWLRWLAWTALAVVLVETWTGARNTLESLPRAAGFLHALLAQLLLSIVIAIAVGVAGRPERDQPVNDSGRPPLRSLAAAMLSLALLQILLGAAYRHGLMGVLLHILNALIVAIVVLVTCVLVIRQFPLHPSLRPAALALGIVTGVQVVLGFATYILIVIDSGTVTALLILSVGHVATGALTSAASVLLTMQIWRNVRLAKRLS